MLFGGGNRQQPAGFSSSSPRTSLQVGCGGRMSDDRMTNNEENADSDAQLQSHCVTTLNVSVSHTIADTQSRESGYLGSSNAKRLIKRATLCKTEYDEPLSFLRQENSASLAVKDVAPFEEHPTNLSLGYSVQCLATHVEDEKKRKATEHVQREKHALIRYINASRRAEGVRTLRVSPLLSQDAQRSADDSMEADRVIGAALTTGGEFSTTSHTHRPANAIATDSESPVVRLESPPGMAALAAAEMWYGGKYRRHQCGVGQVHRLDCPCSLRAAFEIMTDPCWTSVGVGWSKDWRWVVELAF